MRVKHLYFRHKLWDSSFAENVLKHWRLVINELYVGDNDVPVHKLHCVIKPNERVNLAGLVGVQLKNIPVICRLNWCSGVYCQFLVGHDPFKWEICCPRSQTFKIEQFIKIFNSEKFFNQTKSIFDLAFQSFCLS